MNALDKVIAFLSPTAALRRIAGRAALRQIESYEAASKGRRTSHWRRTRNDADADIVPSITFLRNTSRNMVRNNPYAFQAIEQLTNNSIGTGIRPDLKGPAGPLKIVKKYWNDWAEKTECDFTSQLNFYGMQALGGRSMFESGAALIVRQRLKSTEPGVIPIKLQILESDYLDLNKNTDGALIQNKGYIRHGIEYNGKGQRVAYWLFPNHPGSNFGFFSQSQRVDADDVIHLYRILRPGQDHGVPAGVASFLRLNDFDDYEDAQLMRQKIAACFAVFIKGGITDLPTGANATELEQREKLAPGIIERLRPGEEVTMATPPGAEGYGEFARVSLLGGAAGYGVTYEGMTGDLMNVNLSSMRIGDLQFHKRMVQLQLNTFIPQLCDRVFKWFLEALTLVESGINPKDIQYSWTAPRREMVDIDKETKAIANQILFGLNSWSETAREAGNIPEELAQQIADDRKLFEKLGIPYPGDQPPKAEPPADETQAEPADEAAGVKPKAGKNPAKKGVNKS